MSELGWVATDSVVTNNALIMTAMARLADMVQASVNLPSKKALKPPKVMQLLGKIRHVTTSFRCS